MSFDVPYPADYGGAIDVFYKVKALHAAGIAIHLHCYEYGRGHQKALEQYCEKVWYYPRKTGLPGLSLTLPYIVSSRRSPMLLQRLVEVDAPILFEGVHTTYHLGNAALQNRFKAIRIHNIEHDYYAQLSKKEGSLLKKIFFNKESGRLEKYENNLGAAQSIIALSRADHLYFEGKYPGSSHLFVPPFHPYDSVNSKAGSGDYCLYQGNLSHPENQEAALFLLREVFPETGIKLVVAGKKPGTEVADACNVLPNCRLIPDPDETTMRELIANAHIHVLPTFQQSGVKLKLMSSLFGGRHVLANPAMLYGTGLSNEICTVATTAADFIAAISKLINVPFSNTDITTRARLLTSYNNSINAKLISEHIFGA